MVKQGIETVGSLIKIDEVITVEHNILPNTLVLETIEPYPDYHGSDPSGDKPNLIFIITSEEYSIEHILRINNSIRKDFAFMLDATPAVLKIFTDTYYGIRIRGLGNFSQIKQIQESYYSQEIKLYKKKNIQAPALIHLKKTYLLDKLEEGIYKDLIEPLMWYIAVPSKMEWNLLKTITNHVKNNIDNSNFDVAFGWIFIDGITDIIRIYADNLSLEIIKLIRQKYLEEFGKLHIL